MKSIILLLLLLSCFRNAYSEERCAEQHLVWRCLQVDLLSKDRLPSKKKHKEPIEINLEGDEALKKFIATHVKYPAAAAQNGIQGKVTVNFLVTPTGSIANARVISGIEPSLDQEALRVVNSLPNWKPGNQEGDNENVSYTMPINFVLYPQKRNQIDQAQTDLPVEKRKLIIVPNPAQNIATVTLDGSDSTNKLEVSIFSNYGMLICKEVKYGPSFTLSVSNLKSGTYLVVAIDGVLQYKGQMMVNH